MSSVYRPWTLVDGSWPYPWAGATNLVAVPPTALDWATNTGIYNFYQPQGVGTNQWQNIFCNRVSLWLVYGSLDAFGHVDFAIGDLFIYAASLILPGGVTLGFNGIPGFYAGWTQTSITEVKFGDRTEYIKNEEKLPGTQVSLPNRDGYAYSLTATISNDAHPEIIVTLEYSIAVLTNAPEVFQGTCYVPCVHYYRWTWQEADVKAYGGYVSNFNDLPSGPVITAGYDTLISYFRVSYREFGTSDHFLANQFTAYEFKTIGIDGATQTATNNFDQVSNEIGGIDMDGTVWIQPPPAVNFDAAPTQEPYFAYRSDNSNDATIRYDVVTGRKAYDWPDP